MPTTPPSSTFAWNHSGIQAEIANTWMGFAGPGVRPLGQDDQTWLDHSDVRPTMLSLLGLTDTYVHDGRVLFGNLEQSALPVTLRGGSSTTRDLADTYKQLTAPFGQLGQASLIISTAAVSSNTPADATYTNLSNKLINWRAQRDVLGKGTQERIYLCGEETTTTVNNVVVDQGRPWARIVTGPHAGETWQLPRLGRMAYENAVASPFPQTRRS